MKEEKRKRILRVGCLILAGIFALSMLGSVVMIYQHDVRARSS